MASTIPIDENLNVSEEIANFFLFLLNEDRVQLPKLSIKQILLAKGRPGLSAEILSSSIISRFPEAGIPTGPLVGGATNVMESFVKILCEEVVEAIQNDMRIDVVTDAGATVSASGGNSGGPVVSVGATVAPHTGIGVAR
jgi:hypothetical protein